MPKQPGTVDLLVTKRRQTSTQHGQAHRLRAMELMSGGSQTYHFPWGPWVGNITQASQLPPRESAYLRWLFQALRRNSRRARPYHKLWSLMTGQSGLREAAGSRTRRTRTGKRLRVARHKGTREMSSQTATTSFQIDRRHNLTSQPMYRRHQCFYPKKEVPAWIGEI